MLEVMSKLFRRFSAAIILAGAVALAANAALAQQPTTAQRNAVKSACRSDFMAQCSGVSPGGTAALQCLQQHSSSLSAACQQAVTAISGGAAGASASAPPAPAAAPARSSPTTAQRNAIKSACRSDFMAQCSGVTPGGAEALQCLQSHGASLSPSCQKAVAAVGGAGAAGAPASAPPAAAAPAPAMPMRTFSPREEIYIMRQACGSDFRSYCGMVPLGGGRGIACLRQNAARLSPSCKQVLMHGM